MPDPGRVCSDGRVHEQRGADTHSQRWGQGEIDLGPHVAVLTRRQMGEDFAIDLDDELVGSVCGNYFAIAWRGRTCVLDRDKIRR